MSLIFMAYPAANNAVSRRSFIVSQIFDFDFFEWDADAAVAAKLIC